MNFYKKSAAAHTKKEINSDIISENAKLVEDLQKPIIRKIEKKRQDVDPADILLTSRYNKGFQFLLFVVDIFSKYAWVFLLKENKVLQLPMLF